MKNFITPSSHPSSFLTGSTLESMVEKAKDLGTGYYVCTDNGYLTDTLKAYNYANKKGLKPILGCELYVVLDNLKLNGKKISEKIKYFTITIHAKNQRAYQFLIKKISDKKRKTIKILDHEYPVFDWADICDLAEENFTAVIGGPQ
jgi:DNA polymerase III alpha subunit